MQRRNEQENKKGEENEIRVRDCIEVSSAAWLNLNTVFLTMVQG
jgi:hypothetical protein